MPTDQVSEAGGTYDAARRYSLAILAAIAALLFRKLLAPFFGQHNPYHTVWPAVVFSAWYCGLGPSIVTTLTSCIGVWYWFLPPDRSFALQDPAARNPRNASVFLVFSGMIIALGEANRRSLASSKWAEQQLRMAHDELDRKVQERTEEAEDGKRQPAGTFRPVAADAR